VTRDGLKKTIRARIVELTMEAQNWRIRGSRYEKYALTAAARALECERMLNLFDKEDPR
jgi:hypothetical protein